PTYVLSLLGIAETNLSLGYNKTELNRNARDEYLEKARTAAVAAENLCSLLPETHEILGRIASLRAAEMHTAQSNEESDVQNTVDTWQKAVHHLERAIELGSNKKSTLYLMLAQAHVALEEFDGAEEDFRNAIASEPTNDSILPTLYRFGTQYNRYEFLRKTLNQYLQRLKRAAPKEGQIIAKAARYLGSLEYRVYKDEEKAEKAFITATKAAPSNSETWSAFAQFSKQSDRPKAFQHAVTQACRQARETGEEPLPQLEAVVAVWEEGSDKLPEATEKLGRAVRNALESGLMPDQARNAFGWSAEILLVEAQKSDVAKTDRGLAMLNIGTMLNKMGLPSLAATVLKAAVNELPPQQAARAAREASQVLAHQNQKEEAFEMLQKALTLDPDNLETRLAYARSLVKQGRNSQALKEYAKILEIPGLGLEAREAITKEMRMLQ
ncbi:MAG: tetratricopeptide repeat protein, partial [Candidatus Hydrogenedentota bacterium]